jgi:hypothetical protein
MDIVPELNRLHERGEHQVLIVNSGGLEATSQWVAETQARFPVLVQEKLSLSKRYEVFVTPFAFLINEQGIIASKGIAGSKQYLGYVLAGAGNRPGHDEAQAGAEELSEKNQSDNTFSTKEQAHV